MKHKKLTTLILIAIILTLLFTLLIRENQHARRINNYLEAETIKEENRLSLLNDFTTNYNDLYASYNELYGNYKRLYENLSDSGWQEFTVTGYSANDSAQGTNNIVATGFNLNYENVSNLPIAASNCIPLYTIVEIENVGFRIILDTGLGYWTGSGWEDENWIDVLFNSKDMASDFGKQKLMVRTIRR